jgi:hypothetical protein
MHGQRWPTSRQMHRSTTEWDQTTCYKAVAMPTGVWAEPSEESLGESTRRVDSSASATEFLGRRLEVELT